MKNILLINSSNRPSIALMRLFRKLNSDKFSLFLFSSNKNLNRQFKTKIKKSKIIYFGTKIKSRNSTILFFIVLPFIYLKKLIFLIYFKKKYRIDIIVCIENREKIIFTPIADILKIKTIWIEKPNINNNKFILKILKLLSKNVKILTFLESDKNKFIRDGFNKKNINNISIGIKDSFSKHQDSIFSSIAKNVNNKNYHSRFSVGIFLDKDKIQQSEVLFKAIKICLSRFYNLRLVVIGNEIIRKKAMWMAKQADITEITCFIGDIDGIKKIQKSIDIFFALDANLKLIDLSRMLTAIVLKIPIIAFQNGLLKEFIINNKTGILVGDNSPEKIADILMKLQQDSVFRDSIKESAYLYAQDNFSFNKQLAKFEKELYEF